MIQGNTPIQGPWILHKNDKNSNEAAWSYDIVNENSYCCSFLISLMNINNYYYKLNLLKFCLVVSLPPHPMSVSQSGKWGMSCGSHRTEETDTERCKRFRNSPFTHKLLLTVMEGSIINVQLYWAQQSVKWPLRSRILTGCLTMPYLCCIQLLFYFILISNFCYYNTHSQWIFQSHSLV